MKEFITNSDLITNLPIKIFTSRYFDRWEFRRLFSAAYIIDYFSAACFMNRKRRVTSQVDFQLN